MCSVASLALCPRGARGAIRALRCSRGKHSKKGDMDDRAEAAAVKNEIELKTQLVVIEVFVMDCF